MLEAKVPMMRSNEIENTVARCPCGRLTAERCFNNSDVGGARFAHMGPTCPQSPRQLATLVTPEEISQATANSTAALSSNMSVAFPKKGELGAKFEFVRIVAFEELQSVSKRPCDFEVVKGEKRSRTC